MSKKYETEAPGYTMTTVMEEAARCLLCHDAPCSQACPAHTDPGKFIRSVRFRNVKGAAETIRENNALGAICARVCPTEKYCELACSRTGIDRPIDIGGIQRYVTDFEQQAKMDILKKGAANGKSIAIVGSGPAGLQTATTMLERGYAVDIYEKNEKAGGYLTYGIPEYRLPQDIVDFEIKRIVNLGADMHYNVTIGKDMTMADLKADHDAVVVAVGASEAKSLSMFAGNDYVESAVDFLARVKNAKGDITDIPENAVVIGGGDVAMDVATTLKRLDVKNVTDVAYEEFDEFRASKKELAGTRKAGVTIVDGYVPSAVDGNVVTFKHRTIDSELKIKADKIILAIGQQINADNLGINIERGVVPYVGYKTDDPKVYITGDISKGDQTVVWAVRKGKEVADLIDQTLLGGTK
ncbi:dihydropyrimidine dehydrogenase [Secundilactobacillus paracollinoides]|uniref:dihydrouracil dehydrogenase (NAD(+)) n=1 Tax=Secundilactobacillus paracollinoides TaxID=240427 RepID=A0A1B2IW08_9LACO|nr:FAD-dependent oxidoreductase [Secundilactobacillus paracollinoides]ANZ60407.1 dihydropyrimidine dehydrogenase [Secundilactobacillus paracollinoides]ANZ65310.1 dihydropyrimidine dehydrogenase [Secundilactobacillus paracollinoides]ANZ66235.1 dihydropyrimidine dehydrogenase [Secundilactobacillus paracollinoides]KRL76707.1 dihydropyrimidine dehydrogenase subunit A [Secundilactobacillus paracollinoides DSM 15502 = JCM 11969]